MADASVNMASTKAKITLPSSIDDPGPKGWGEDDHNGSIPAAIIEHWNEEIERAREASTWSINFTLRIKNILKI